MRRVFQLAVAGRFWVLTLGMLCVASPARAAILLFDVVRNPAAWATSTAGLTASTAYDFRLDSDYGLQLFDGPLTSAGSGPVSQGILAPGVTMNRIDFDGLPPPGLVALGPLAGFGNVSNAIVASWDTDGFAVLSFASPVDGFRFDGITLFGVDGSVDITVHDNTAGTTIFSDVFVGSGHTYGLLGTAGTKIAGVDIYDRYRGFEGVAGLGVIYTAVPEPASIAAWGLLGLGGLVYRVRRRMKA